MWGSIRSSPGGTRPVALRLPGSACSWVVVEGEARVDDEPRRGGEDVGAAVEGEEGAEAEVLEDQRADDGLHGVAEVAEHVHEAAGGAGVAAADGDDRGPVGRLAHVVGGGGDAH